jgi:hypothetical protein
MIFSFFWEALLVAVDAGLFLFLAGYMAYRRRFTHGGYLLLALIMILLLSGVAQLAFRWSPEPAVILLANVWQVFCFLCALTIVVHFSLYSFTKAPFLWANELYLLLYLPAVVVALVYAATPLMLAGAVYTPFGCELIYGPGFWAVVVLGLALCLASFLLEFIMLLKRVSASENRQALLSLLILGLLAYYYLADLVLPFFWHDAALISPLPVTLAIAILIYEFIEYHYVSLENV